MGWSMQSAAPVALIAVAGGASVGAIEGLRKGLVRYKAALLMVATGLPFTSLGQAAAHQLPQHYLLGLFAVVMLIVAIRLWRQAGRTICTAKLREGAIARINPKSGRFHWSWSTACFLACLGALTGFMTGLLGVGGGFVLVPMMRRFTDVTMHGIVATSLMVIALVGMGGVISAMLRGTQLPQPATLMFALATAIGMVLGRTLVARIAEEHVQRGFAMILLIVAFSLMLKAGLAAL
jgi:uncharacterized membrane protein YfcA